MTLNSKYTYWYFKNVLTEKFCNDVIKRGNAEKESLALTGDLQNKNPESLSDKDENDLKKIRDSRIAWLSDNWIYAHLHPYLNTANKNAGWNYEWDFSEACQFTKYKLNQYYNWHKDDWEKAYEKPNNPNYNGKTRKLSMSVQLSDCSEYEGGELEFQPRDIPDPNYTVPCTESQTKGSIIIFPSYVWHRVKPVTKGIRYSLVVWSLGQPYI